MGIGDKLNELLQKRGRNINELAVAIQVSPQTLYSIAKRNNTKVDLDVLQKIADELCVTLDYFSNANYSSNEKFSPEALSIANQYQQLDSFGKKAVKATIQLELERQKQQEETDTLKSLSMKELLEANRLEDAPRYGVTAAATGNNEKFLVSKENEIEAKKILDDIHNQKLD